MTLRWGHYLCDWEVQDRKECIHFPQGIPSFVDLAGTKMHDLPEPLILPLAVVRSSEILESQLKVLDYLAGERTSSMYESR